VIVVSADRPVSVIQEGVETSAQCQWTPVTYCHTGMTPLAEYVKE